MFTLLIIAGDILKNGILSNLEPKKVFEYFEIISSIPRGSGKTEKISDYCESFAKEKGLRYHRDEIGNVVIFKNGSAGRENEEPVILQGHLDMVCEKENGCNIDFDNDGLSLAVDGDFVYAQGTTLGGDDGIAVAMCLALLDSNEYSHPPVEVVFTVDEETGMFGAEALDTSILGGKRMINIDSENEGVLWVSCAGGARIDIESPFARENNAGNCIEITVGGLHGGHSGAEIHVGYANASVLMGRLLSKLSESFELSLVSINGGTKDNAITRENIAVISTDGNSDEIKSAINETELEFKAEFSSTDPDLFVKADSINSELAAINKETTQNIIALLNELPYGVMAMSDEIEGLVETSLNLGTLRTAESSVHFGYSVRSSKDDDKEKLLEKLVDIAKNHSATSRISGIYPGWAFKKDSPLQQIMAEVYKNIYGKDMLVTAIHAGLECGLFCGKISGLDCVSLGPDLFDIHTPSERMSISSVKRVWEYLLCVLEKL